MNCTTSSPELANRFLCALSRAATVSAHITADEKELLKTVAAMAGMAVDAPEYQVGGLQFEDASDALRYARVVGVPHGSAMWLRVSVESATAAATQEP